MSKYLGLTRWAGHLTRSLGVRRQPSASLMPFIRANNRGMSDRAELKLQRPSNFEKKVLVYTKFYPSVDAVPKEVSSVKIVKSKDLFRIRVSIGMMIMTAVASLVIVLIGRRAAKSGESMYKDNIDQFRQRHQTSITQLPSEK